MYEEFAIVLGLMGHLLDNYYTGKVLQYRTIINARPVTIAEVEANPATRLLINYIGLSGSLVVTSLLMLLLYSLLIQTGQPAWAAFLMGALFISGFYTMHNARAMKRRARLTAELDSILRAD